MSNSDHEANLIGLLKTEIALRPKDTTLHSRLINHYLCTNKYELAFEHICNIEFTSKAFINNITWYETLIDLLKQTSHNNGWVYQLILLTVKERVCYLSLSEIPTGTSKSLVESNELLYEYDQALELVSKEGDLSEYGEFHTALLQHHRGQFALHSATFLLKKAKKNQLNWNIATKSAAPLMLIAWHAEPINPKVHWISLAPEKQCIAVNRWYAEANYRCSQSGHYLLRNFHNKSQAFLDEIHQCCSGTHWKDNLYEKLFASRNYLAKIETSHFASKAYYNRPILRLPRKTEVEKYDDHAQKVYANSLHHFIWILINYKNYAHFKCTTFDMLTSSSISSGLEYLNKIDIQAFLYCAALTTQQKLSTSTYMITDKPSVLPANITDILCTLPQMKWWECAYKFSQNELGTELTDLSSILRRGIEVVRCVDNHNLDPLLLCSLGEIFKEKAQLITNSEDKYHLEERAFLYYSSAIPLLEKLNRKMVIEIPNNRMFDYTHKDPSTEEVTALIEQSKLFVAIKHYHEDELDTVIDLLCNMKSIQTYYYLSKTYKRIALEKKKISEDFTSEAEEKCVAFLSKAKALALKALDNFKEVSFRKSDPMYFKTQELLKDIDTQFYTIRPQTGEDNFNYHLSDFNNSYENISMKTSVLYRDLGSTPKLRAKSNTTKHNNRTATDSQLRESKRIYHRYLESIESEKKNLQERDVTINDFMEQIENSFEENNKFKHKMMNTVNHSIKKITDQCKQLRIPLDQVKNQIQTSTNNCKDVGYLKQHIAELKKEVDKLAKSSSKQMIDENDLYNLTEDYRTNNTVSGLASQLSSNTRQDIPPINQGTVPSNPYQFYNHSTNTLPKYYSKFTQPSTVPEPPQKFNPAMTQINYQGTYSPCSFSTCKTIAPIEDSQSQPINTVITSSDPTSMCTFTPTPVCSIITHHKKYNTLSESTSVENYDQFPDFKQIVPHPAEIKVTTGEEDETVIFKSRAKLFRFIHNQWRERGLGEMKLLKHNDTGRVRVLMRREQVHKICANHIITSDMEIKPMKNETNAYFWVARDFANEVLLLEIFCIRFKTADIAHNFYDTFENARLEVPIPSDSTKNKSVLAIDKKVTEASLKEHSNEIMISHLGKVASGGFALSSTPTFKAVQKDKISINDFLNESNVLSDISNSSVDKYDQCLDFKPIMPLPAEVKVTTGEEDETVIFSSRAKLFRFADKRWKERGLGEIKLLKHKVTGKVRVLMRREQVHKICANHIITSDMEIKPMKNETNAYFWVARDFANEVLLLEIFCIRFKTADVAHNFYDTFEKARLEVPNPTESTQNKSVLAIDKNITEAPLKGHSNEIKISHLEKAASDGFALSSTPTFKAVQEDEISINDFLNESNVLSDIRNSSVENNDPYPDFNPSMPLPTKVKVTTGEEDETVIFSSRAKLFRFADKRWKERGVGVMKLLKHNITGKVRVLMRREQVHKICANHYIASDMEIKPMKNETNAYFWVARDFANEVLLLEIFCIRFKTADIAHNFYDTFENARLEVPIPSDSTKNKSVLAIDKKVTEASLKEHSNEIMISHLGKVASGGFALSSTPTFKAVQEDEISINDFLNESNVLSDIRNSSVENNDPYPDFNPSMPLPTKVKVTTGEEDETVIFSSRAKLFRFADKRWKERGVGVMKLLKHNITGKVRVLMRREQVHKICANHNITSDMEIKPMKNESNAYFWVAKDFANEVLLLEMFCVCFKTADIAHNFYDTFEKARLEVPYLTESTQKSVLVTDKNITEVPQENILINKLDF